MGLRSPAKCLVVKSVEGPAPRKRYNQMYTYAQTLANERNALARTLACVELTFAST
ncbi:hypothetical protein WN55_02939 [Dufourea novaeangliae]|uniref:Uncharacterized protein n=1 Tax=Dufourea novaeangliae TaxID=178035 RepID=A0A154PIM2_DUFNO|nr:hypothetical protein WN55_02939 [Dufourea novaeangliae]